MIIKYERRHFKCITSITFVSKKKQMGVSIRIIKALRLGLMFIFLVFLLWIYAYLPEKVNIFSSSELPEYLISISKNGFFYIFLLVFVVINGIMSVYFNLIIDGADHLVPGLFNRTEKGRRQFTHWVGALYLVLDFFILISLLHFGLSNIMEPDMYSADWPLLVGPAMLALLLLVLFYLMIDNGKK